MFSLTYGASPAVLLLLLLLLLFFFFFFFFFFNYPRYSVPAGFIKLGGKEKCVFHRPSSVGQNCQNEPANEMALHLWTMTEMRWNRKAVSLGSPEDADKRRPKQAKNLSPSSLIGPKVSIATGQNKYVRLSSWYLSFFNFAALSDAAPATKLVQPNASGLAYGHGSVPRKTLPSSQLTKVQPSGRPSPERMRPTGSLVEGMPALTKALWIASFSWAWRVCLPALLRQDNPWLPLASTNAPQGQLWREQRFCSESKTNSDSNCFIVHAEPTRGYGPCVEPVPAVDARDASSRALLYWSVWVVSKWSWLFATDALSQVFCLVCVPTSGIWPPCLPVQVIEPDLAPCQERPPRVEEVGSGGQVWLQQKLKKQKVLAEPHS